MGKTKTGGDELSRNKRYQHIPTFLEEGEFNEFICPHLTNGSRGPARKLSSYKLFNYLLKFLHTGCQWSELPIDKGADGKPEIHYSRLFRIFQGWQKAGCFEKIFVGSVVV